MLYLNGQPLSVTIFPDNTSQVWKLPESAFISKLAHVRWDYSHEGEIAHLAQLKMLLQSKGVRATLTITYLPYGRQDKEISNESTFALRAFAHFVNMLSFEEIAILDPHSSVALELIRFSHAIYPTEQVAKIVQEQNIDVVCYPDKGAVQKYTHVYSYPWIHGEKVRDQLTGNILKYDLIGDPKGRNVLIVDDICDGGMTFKLLAKDLLAAGAKEVNLFVTHGIFSKGVRTLKEAGIKRVFDRDGEKSGRWNTFHI